MVRHVSPRTALLATLTLVAALTVATPGFASHAGLHISLVADNSVDEGDDGTMSLDFKVSVDELEEDVPPGEDIEFTWETVQDTATAGEDYVEVVDGTGTITGLAKGGTDSWTTITVEINGDGTIEPEETFQVELVDVTSDNAEINTGTVVGTIKNDDPNVSVADTQTTEGDDAVFTVTLSDPIGRSITVDYHTIDDGDAGDGSDYTGTDGSSVTIEAGETTTTITVPTLQDTEPEPDETFTVELTEVDDGNDDDDEPDEPRLSSTVGALAATGLILDDEPRVSIDDVAVTEGHSGTTDAVFTVTIDPPPAEEVSVEYETADVSDGNAATADDDYQSTDGPVTFDPGEATRPIVVKVNGDVEIEGDEHFEVQLTGISDPTVAYLPPDTTGTGTIIADDGEPKATISDASASEGDAGNTTPLTFTVSLDEPSGGDIVLDYTTADGPESGSDTTAATDGRNDFTGEPDEDEDTDYQTAGTRPPTQEEIDGDCSEDEEQPANSVTIPAGDTQATFTVDLVGDDTHEPDEAFTVTLTQPCEGDNPPLSLEDETATGTIVNDDDRPTITADDTSVDEGDAHSRFAEFGVRLSHPSSSCIEVDFATADGTATVADDDYEAASGLLIFSPGSLAPDENASDHDDCDEDSDPPVVKVLGDEQVEATETFDLELFNPDGAVFADDATQLVATGKIVNDDGPEVSIGDTEVTEGDSGTVDAVLRLTTPSSAHDGFSVDWSTVDGTATAGSDYTAASGTATFAPNAESATVVVPVRGDTEDEPDETFTVELSNPDQAAIADGTGQVTIVDDDGAGGDGDPGNGQPTADAGADRSGEVGDLLTFAASATDPDGDTLTYYWDFDDGTTATGREADHRWASPGDYSVTVTADDGNGGQATDALTVQIAADSGRVGRSAGTERVATALAVAADHWSTTATASSGDVNAPEGPHAVLATAATFPDALAGGALAALLDAPLLLTFPAELDPRVLDELARRNVQRVWILGGHAAISPQIETELTEAGYEVIRYAGSNRFETAAQIARGVGPSLAGEVVVALGAHADPNRAWPDALSAGALTATPDPPPVLLTTDDRLPDVTAQTLVELQASKVFLMGGTAAVSTQVEQELADLGLEVERVAGVDRYATSVAAARAAMSRHPAGEMPTVFATGNNFPDGLSAGALAAHLDGLLLLVPNGHLPESTAGFLADHAFGLDAGVVVGGDLVVSEDVRTAAASAMRAS